MSADHVEQILTLLQDAPDTDWTPDTPTIKRYWDDARSERGPGADQPGVLYVWSPTTSSLDRFSMDGTRFDRTDTVEVQIWALDAAESQQLQSDAADILGETIDDNAVNTPYSTVEPTGLNDFREQKPARQTDHYVMSVEVEARGLDETGLNVA
jgi:hypothetical protein